MSVCVGEFAGHLIAVWARLGLQPARQDGYCTEQDGPPALTPASGRFGFKFCQLKEGPPCCLGPGVGIALLSVVAGVAEMGHRLPPDHSQPG